MYNSANRERERAMDADTPADTGGSQSKPVARPTASPPAREDVAELKAAVEARRELGPDFEDHVLETFLARIQQQVDAQLAQRKADKPAKAGKPMKGERVQVEIVAGTFALAIPLMAISQVTAGAVGVLFVMLGVVAVNLLYFIDRWVRMN
jgi:hypothetical protein